MVCALKVGHVLTNLGRRQKGFLFVNLSDTFLQTYHSKFDYIASLNFWIRTVKFSDNLKALKCNNNKTNKLMILNKSKQYEFHQL